MVAEKDCSRTRSASVDKGAKCPVAKSAMFSIAEDDLEGNPEDPPPDSGIVLNGGPPIVRSASCRSLPSWNRTTLGNIAYERRATLDHLHIHHDLHPHQPDAASCAGNFDTFVSLHVDEERQSGKSEKEMWKVHQ